MLRNVNADDLHLAERLVRLVHLRRFDRLTNDNEPAPRGSKHRGIQNTGEASAEKATHRATPRLNHPAQPPSSPNHLPSRFAPPFIVLLIIHCSPERAIATIINWSCQPSASGVNVHQQQQHEKDHAVPVSYDSLHCTRYTVLQSLNASPPTLTMADSIVFVIFFSSSLLPSFLFFVLPICCLVFFALLFSFPPSRNSDPGSHISIAASSTPSPTSVSPLHFYRENTCDMSGVFEFRLSLL